MSEPQGATRATTAPALAPEALAIWFRASLSGAEHADSPEIVWSDCGSQILLHVGKLQVRLAKATLVVAVDTESVEFGVAPLVVRFVFGADGGPSSLVAATDADALGHPDVAARWGDLFRDVIWAAFSRLVDLHSGEGVPGGLTVQPRGLSVAVQKPFSTVDLAVAHRRGLVEEKLRDAPRGRDIAPDRIPAPGGFDARSPGSSPRVDPPRGPS